MLIPTSNQESIDLWKHTDTLLTGAERRKFRARVVRSLGRGGQCYAEEVLQWGRNTIRKGEHELSLGVDCEDQFSKRGRKPAEYYLPELLTHIKEIIEPCSQTDPTFLTSRVYTPLTAEAVRSRLIRQFNYTDKELPCVRILRNKINALGYHLKKLKNVSL